MIYLLHGEGQSESRSSLLEFISKAKEDKKEVVKIDGKTVNLPDLRLALRAETFFSSQKLLILESFFSRPKSKQKDKILNFLKKKQTNQDIVLWEGKKIPGTTTRWLKNWQIKEFSRPVLIFKFLESLTPNNTAAALKLLKSCLKKDAPELVFYMLARQIQNLILAKDLGEKGVLGAPWQKKKLILQAGKFTLNNLTSVYNKLLNIDADIKTGKSLMPLGWQLDFLLASWLN
jgi:DNA polymerase III delta subunit